MDKIFGYDSPIIQTINKIVDCVIVSILWVLFSIPIITFGASTTAFYYTVNKVIRHHRSHVFREFWGSFKSTFKQSTIVWLILLVLYYVLVVDCYFVYLKAVEGTVSIYFMVPFAITLVLVLIWSIYVFGTIARFQNDLKTIMKNSAFLVIRHLLRSILLVVVLAAAVLVFMFVPISVVILPTVCMFLITVILESIFQRYMTEEDLAAEAERNQTYYV